MVASSPTAAGPRLGVAGPAFQRDGRNVFLSGVSLFDALGSTPPRDQDLDALKTWGITAVRVWAHWHEAIYQSDGTLSAAGRTRLVALAQRLDVRGLTFELVLLRPGQLPGQPFAVFAAEAARARAVEAISTAIRDFRNVVFDLYNEHDHPDGPISHQTARALRDKVKALDPTRLVTISSTEHHLVDAATGTGATNLREEAGTGPDDVAVDIVAPHFPRTDDWAAATGARVRALRTALEGIGRPLPIYLNEERRANPGEQVDAADYRLAMEQAVRAGAAGWVFHTAAGFELKQKPFLDALAAGEREALQKLVAR